MKNKSALALGLAVLLGATVAPVWEFLGGVGALRWVYVDPARIKDPQLLADIVQDMYKRFGKDHALQIDFFDDKAQAPQTNVYTMEQRRHHRAKFNFNPKNGMQRFLWLELVPDPNTPGKMRIKETEEKLPLPPITPAP